jgi:hypothetical protein
MVRVDASFEQVVFVAITYLSQPGAGLSRPVSIREQGLSAMRPKTEIIM